MSDLNFLHVLVRWVHLSSVIVLVGGAVFLRFVLMPAASQLPTEAHNSLKKWVMDRWRYFVHPLVALLVLSGLYNFATRLAVVSSLWHMLFGIKFILALLFLFFASVLVGRSKGLEPLRAKSPKLLAFNITLAAIIVLLSSVLKNLPSKSQLASPPAAVSQQ